MITATEADWEATFAAHCLIALSKSRSSYSCSLNTNTDSSIDHDKSYLKKNISRAYATRSSSKVPLNQIISRSTLNHRSNDSLPPSPSDRVLSSQRNVAYNLNAHHHHQQQQQLCLPFTSNTSSPIDSPDDGGHTSPSISSIDSLPFTLGFSSPVKCDMNTAGPFFTATTPSSPSSSSSSSFSPVALDQPVDLTRSANGKFHLHFNLHLLVSF